MVHQRTVFAQLMDLFPTYEFRQCVARYHGHYKVQSFSCQDQFLCLAFAQLTYRESLRDIETCLRAMQSKLYHIGFRGRIARSTLADANEKRDWRIFADFAQGLIAQARPLYADEPLGLELDQTVYAFDSTTIDLCLALFPWAPFRQHKSAIKLHTLLDLRGSIPTFVHITSGKIHDVNILDELLPEPGAIYILDRGYLDFARLFRFHQHLSRFVIRAKSNLQCQRVYSQPVEKSTGMQCDQIIRRTGLTAAAKYPEQLRRIRYYDADKEKRLIFLTNDFTLPAFTIAELYRCRWQVELFFKWIKQHLRIKAFYGTSENAVKTQVWVAIAVYVMAAILKKNLKLELSLYTILQILSLTLFEKRPILQVFSDAQNIIPTPSPFDTLTLFDL
ncbi:MAG TPA: IS4 family transposase [bacterium]|nr:IS4 family transposase [bacterium]